MHSCIWFVLHVVCVNVTPCFWAGASSLVGVHLESGATWSAELPFEAEHVHALDSGQWLAHGAGGAGLFWVRAVAGDVEGLPARVDVVPVAQERSHASPVDGGGTTTAHATMVHAPGCIARMGVPS